MKFFCDRCGLCCRNIKNIVELQNFNRGDGICKYFDETTNLCKIYEKRPIVCRVDEFYEKYLKNQMDKKEYYKKNYEVCLILKGEK